MQPVIKQTLPAVFLTTLAVATPLVAQDSTPGIGDSAYVAGEYRVFTGAGEPATLDDVVAAMLEHDVAFIGEAHDDPTGHMLELELLRRAYEGVGDRPIGLSLEFFQRDAQPIVDEYLADLITEQAFRADSRPWPRYETDYRPLVEFSKENGIPVIAANAPRRYTNRVTRGGREALEDLSDAALATLAPLPYGQPSDAYRDQWINVIAGVMEQDGMKCGRPIPVTEDGEPAAHAAAPAGAHDNMGNQLHSQTLWDATMAYWISRHLASEPDALVLHMVGSFHVARGTGTPEHLDSYAPDASRMIVMLRPVDDIDEFDPAPSGEWGDFVIQTDRSRTLEQIECRTYLEALDAPGDPAWDHHLHLGSATTGRLAETPRDATTAEQAIEALDEAGIESGLVLSLAYWLGAEDLPPDEEIRLVREENDYVAAQVAASGGRLTGACSIHPLKPYASEEIARCSQDLGLPILKLHLTNSDVDLRSPAHLAALRDVFAALSDRGMGAVVHMRTAADDYGAADARHFIDEVLSPARDVPVQIAHMGGWGGYDAATDAALGEFVDALADGRLDRDYVRFGLAAVVFQPAAAGADTALARGVAEANETLATRIRQLGPERVVYATDWPSWPPVPDPAARIAANVRLVRAELGLTDAELAVVFRNMGLPGILAHR